MVPHGRKYGILAVLLIVLAGPAIAGTKYMDGSPDLSVSISGPNEFSPGADISIPVVVKNTGINEYKFIQLSVVDRDDLPNTAKLLTVSLYAGDAPLEIRSDPQMVGDLTGGNAVIGTFDAKVDRDAKAGTYYLPVSLNYTYLYASEQYGMDSMRYYYHTANETLSLPVTIKPELSIGVIAAEPEHVNVGTDGYLNLRIQNTGSGDGKNAVVRIVRNGDSPVIPTDNSVYIGDFPAGSVADCRYKVSVAPGAESSVYPVDIVVDYENDDGDTVTSRSETVGIPVGNKIDFAVVSDPAEIHPGEMKTIAVAFKNTGNTTVYSARARISAVDPFTSNNDIAYLGEIDPGQTVTASFGISVDRDATVKEYGLDSEIRYRDALDNTYISDTMKVRMDVTAQTGIDAVLANPILLSVIAAALIAAGYALLRFRKKNA